MADQSTGKEFLEVAVEIERNGRSFYDKVAKQTREKETKAVFLNLSEREKQHEKTYLEMLGRLGGYQPPGNFREHFEYIQDLARSAIFSGEKAQAALAKKSMTDIEAVETGIGFEKDSILFYSEFRPMLPAPDQNIVDIIISEERKHLSELSYRLTRLRSSM